MKQLLVMAVLLSTIGCGTDNVLQPSMIIIPDAVTIGVGQSQVFITSETHADIIFRVSSDAGDWHQFVKATGQAYDRIQLTGIKPTGDKEVYVAAQDSGDSIKIAVAVLRVVR